MNFLISMADVEDEWDALPQAERERVGARHLGCWGAHPSRETRTLRRHANGSFSVTSGRMTPTSVSLGGFYIIEGESMDEAIEWARKGRFRAGTNEVRELRED